VTPEQADDKRRNRRISLLFVLPIAAVALQFALIYGGYGEPYPALMMPSFGGNPTNAAGAITFMTVEAEVGFADGKGTEPLTLARLFAPMPNSMHNPTAWDVFRPTPISASDNRPIRTGLKAWLIDHVLPMRTRRHQQMENGNVTTADTRRWLSERTRSLYPARRATWVEYRWYRDTYQRVDTAVRRTDRTQTARAHIDLNR
jgi:hypothetical protein